MPRPRSKELKYCLHKPSGRAYARVAGKCVYLGTYNSPESRDEYERVKAEWIVSGKPGSSLAVDDNGPTITQVIIAFWRAHQTYYPPYSAENPPPPNKHPVGELGNYFDALRPLRRLYGTTPASDFGPLRLKTLRDEMIKLGWSRNTINRQVSRIKHVFAWALSEELLDSSRSGKLRPGDKKSMPAPNALWTVSGLKAGRTEARETEPVTRVANALVETTLRLVSPQVAAMIQLQHLTGMRPGEVVIMRLADIDRRTGELWVYTPPKHKTAHHGHSRVIYLGPKAREILQPFLTLDPDRYLFSPGDAEDVRRERLHADRKTPTSQGNLPGSNCREEPNRTPGDCYSTSSYRRAIRRACEAQVEIPAKLGRQRIKAGPRRTRWESKHEWKERLGPEAWAELQNWKRQQRWHPHQLRHTAGSEVREQFGAVRSRC